MRHILKLKALLILCFALLLFAACKSQAPSNGNASAGADGKGSNVKSGDATADTGSSISPSDDPREALSKSMRALFAAKSFRARMEGSAAGRSITMLMEYVAPDRYHMKSEMGEIIVVGSNAYQNMGGTWSKMPGDAGKLISNFRDPKMLDEINKSANIKFVGTDTLDGKPMLVYQYTIDNFQGMPVKSTSKTWIGASDSLPYKVESEGEYNSMKSKTVGTYYDYGADISIEPPIQ